MMPEIVGKWYTRRPVADVDDTVACGYKDPEDLTNQSKKTEDEEKENYLTLWCYCNTPSSGDMIQCPNALFILKVWEFKHRPKENGTVPHAVNYQSSTEERKKVVLALDLVRQQMDKD